MPGVVAVGPFMVLDHLAVEAGVAAAGHPLALAGAAQVEDQLDAEIAHGLQVGLGGLGLVGGAEQQALLDALLAGGVVAEIAEVLDGFEGNLAGHAG
jgi:hypothetical protein